MTAEFDTYFETSVKIKQDKDWIQSPVDFSLTLSMHGQIPGGVLNFGLGRGVPLGFLKCHPSMYPFWRKSDPSMYQKSKFFAEICAILAQISENLKSWPIKVPNLRHFGANFRKFWKIDPSKYHVFEKKKGPIDVPGGLILLPMFAAHPYNHFCTEYPPPPGDK